jgi:hypothetical protein
VSPFKRQESIMSRAALVWSLVALAAACGAHAVGQQEGGQPPPPAPGGPPASFTVSPAGDSAVLLETRSGRTWLLVRSSDRTQPAVWLPIERLDQREQAAEWNAQQRERARVMQQNGPLEHRLTELRSILADHRSRIADPNQNPVIQRLEAEIAALEARLRMPPAQQQTP